MPGIILGCVCTSALFYIKNRHNYTVICNQGQGPNSGMKLGHEDQMVAYK